MSTLSATKLKMHTSSILAVQTDRSGLKYSFFFSNIKIVQYKNSSIIRMGRSVRNFWPICAQSKDQKIEKMKEPNLEF